MRDRWSFDKFVNSHVFAWVYWFIVEAHLIVEVSACGSAAVANSTNGLTTCYLISAFYEEFLHVCKFGCVAIAVSDFNVPSIASVKEGFSDNAVCCGKNFLAVGPTHINTGMETFFSIHRIGTMSKSGGDKPRDGTTERQGLNCVEVVL